MTHSTGIIHPRHYCSQQTSRRLSLRVDRSNPDHHLWNNNGTWYVHYTVAEPGLSGERKRQSLHTHDRREARRLRDQLLAGIGITAGSWDKEVCHG